MSKHGRILVAMSGGIDSSVAALMLHEQGYEVIGITMKTWDYAATGGEKKETGCCSLDSINDARQVSVDLGFPHMVLDIRDTFNDQIINNFVEEYLGGRTPNPCVLCNTHIKWEALLKRADQLDCPLIATGHYSRIKTLDGRFFVSKSADPVKDQSYVLWGVSQENLKRTVFPLGDHKKEDIKKFAEEAGYKNLAGKQESYEICFIPENDYRSFLSRKAPRRISELDQGMVVNMEGRELGRHRGYPFYTIGQRKGLGIAAKEPLYVVAIDPENNRITLGPKKALQQKKMQVRRLTMQKYVAIEDHMAATIRIRYHHCGSTGSLHRIDGDRLEVRFHDNVSAITPGQSAVFYEGDDVIGGGFIDVVSQIPETNDPHIRFNKA